MVAYVAPPQQMEKCMLIQPPNTKSTVFPVGRLPGTLSQPPIQRRTTAGSQRPYVDPGRGVFYFRTPVLVDDTHDIGIMVTTANETNLFILDYFLVTSGTSSSIPSIPVGAIVGGIAGVIIGIAILAVAVWYFCRRRSRGGRAYYFEMRTPGDMLTGEGP